MQTFFQVLMAVTFVIALIICPVAWYRMVRAQTRVAYWGNMGLFSGLILAVFLFAEIAGFETGLRNAPSPPQQVPSFGQVVGHMPPMQLALLISAAVLWIGGGHVLFHLHNRRLGKRWWQTLNPFDPPFKDFNGREWAALGVLMVGALVLGAAAITVGPVQ